MTEFKDREQLEAWLRDQPREVSVVLAARAALRVVPALSGAPTTGRYAKEYHLPLFRAVALAWATARFPARGTLRSATAAAARHWAKRVGYMALDADLKDHGLANAVATLVASAADAAMSARQTSAAYHAARAVEDAYFTVFALRKLDSGGSWPFAVGEFQLSSVDALAVDVAVIEMSESLPEGKYSSSDLAKEPLWAPKTPRWAESRWQKLKRNLLAANESWHVWTDWYEDRIKGSPEIESLEVDRLMLPKELWRQGPRVVNAEIRRLIEEYSLKPPPPPSKPKTPKIPPLRPAALEPDWNKGRLELPSRPAVSNLRGKALGAALKALRADLRELAGDIANEANIDKRVAAYLRSVADRIPDKAPPQDELFRLAHAKEMLDGYAVTVTAEWPDFLAGRFHATTLAYDRTMRQIPRWRAFVANAEKDKPRAAHDPAKVAEAAAEVGASLRHADAQAYIPEEMPTALAQLAAPLTSADEMLAQIVPGKELLAEDVLESTNAILKRIAEYALAAKRVAGKSFVGKAAAGYAKKFGPGFVNAAEKQADKDGASAFKWTRRILIGAATGGVPASAVAWLIAAYPDKFGWLAAVVKFLF